MLETRNGSTNSWQCWFLHNEAGPVEHRMSHSLRKYHNPLHSSLCPSSGGDGELTLPLTEEDHDLVPDKGSPAWNSQQLCLATFGLCCLTERQNLIFSRAAWPFYSFLGLLPCGGETHYENESQTAENKEILTATTGYILKFSGVSKEHLSQDLFQYVSLLPIFRLVQQESKYLTISFS